MPQYFHQILKISILKCTVCLNPTFIPYPLYKYIYFINIYISFPACKHTVSICNNEQVFDLILQPVLMATISPIHLRAPLSIPPYISEAKGIWRHHVGRRFHLTQSTFPTSRNAGGIRSFSTAFSACIEQRSTCNKTKQKKNIFGPVPCRTAYLPRCRTRAHGRCTRSFVQRLQASVRKRYMAAQIAPAQLQVLPRSEPYSHPRRPPLESAPPCGRREREARQQQVYGGRDRIGCCLQVQSGNI